MGYQEALEAAGCTVHEFNSYGSYQGTWLAAVELPDGDRVVIRGDYGSCSGCDSYEAAFSWGENATPEKLAEFGSSYLGSPIRDVETLHAELKWDSDINPSNLASYIKWLGK